MSNTDSNGEDCNAIVTAQLRQILVDKEHGVFGKKQKWLKRNGKDVYKRQVANALDAKKTWLEAALEEGVEIHEPVLCIPSFQK